MRPSARPTRTIAEAIARHQDARRRRQHLVAKAEHQRPRLAHDDDHACAIRRELGRQVPVVGVPDRGNDGHGARQREDQDRGQHLPHRPTLHFL